MHNAANFRETEKYKVVLFCHKNTLKVKECTVPSQTCDFLVIIAAWRAYCDISYKDNSSEIDDIDLKSTDSLLRAWRAHCDISYKDNSSETDDIDLKSTNSMLSIFIDIFWPQLISI